MGKIAKLPKQTHQPYTKAKGNVVIVAGRVFDLDSKRYEWLKGYDKSSREYILRGMAT